MGLNLLGRFAKADDVVTPEMYQVYDGPTEVIDIGRAFARRQTEESVPKLLEALGKDPAEASRYRVRDIRDPAVAAQTKDWTPRPGHPSFELQPNEKGLGILERHAGEDEVHPYQLDKKNVMGMALTYTGDDGKEVVAGWVAGHVDRVHGKNGASIEFMASNPQLPADHPSRGIMRFFGQEFAIQMAQGMQGAAQLDNSIRQLNGEPSRMGNWSEPFDSVRVVDPLGPFLQNRIYGPMGYKFAKKDYRGDGGEEPGEMRYMEASIGHLRSIAKRNAAVRESAEGIHDALDAVGRAMPKRVSEAMHDMVDAAQEKITGAATAAPRPSLARLVAASQAGKSDSR